MQEGICTNLRVDHAGSQRGIPSTNFVAVPLLPVRAGTPGKSGDKTVDLEQVRPEAMLAAPMEWCPNPKSTISLRVRGNSMSPLILDGYIIAIDILDVH